MVQKTQVVIVDDLTGDVLAEGQGQTVSFGFDGTSYEIDLDKDNADVLRQAFKRYIDAGRRVGRQASTGGARGGSHVGRRNRQDTAAIRAWARENGHEVSERGRIPSSILQAYDAAH